MPFLVGFFVYHLQSWDYSVPDQSRPAVEIMLSAAEAAAEGTGGVVSYNDVFGTGEWFMLQVRFLPPAAKFIKKLKDKKLKELYKEAIDEICEDYTVREKNLEI